MNEHQHRRESALWNNCWPRDMSVEGELARLRAENARLCRLLDLTAEQALPPQATQTGLVLGRPGPVAAASPASEMARFFRDASLAACFHALWVAKGVAPTASAVPEG